MAKGANDTSTIWTPANKVTFVRIVLIPVFVAALLAPWPDYFPDSESLLALKPWLAAAVFVVISLTDMLDGYLARRRNEVTDFGKFMDPLADKLLVSAALLGLVELGAIPSWVALVIVSREFIVSGVRMVAASKGKIIAASGYGKAKTVFQMIAIVMFIIKEGHTITDFNELLGDWLYLASWAVMFVALALTVLSMLDYLYKARHLLGFQKQDDAAASRTTPEGDLLVGFEGLASALIDHARERGLMVATAESCTGGMICAALTAVAGSSDVVAGGIVSYSNDVKKGVLGVDEQTLASVGAVSEQTACQMAEGALERTGADYAVSVTGIAGPGGGSPEKPVGTVWIGVAGPDGVSAHLQHFAGDRAHVRHQTVEKSLSLLDSEIVAHPSR